MISFWLVELVAAYEHRTYIQYYAGYQKPFDDGVCSGMAPVVTMDASRAARFSTRYDAHVVALSLKAPKDCIFRAAEHIFYDERDLADLDPDCLPSC